MTSTRDFTKADVDFQSALAVAVKAHATQLDKQGEPYILHVIRVMQAVPNHLRVPALLHDVLEDTPYTEDMLTWLGFSATDVTIVGYLTRDKSKPYKEYIQRMLDLTEDVVRESVITIKVEDLWDNFTRGAEFPSLQARYVVALDMLGYTVLELGDERWRLTKKD